MNLNVSLTNRADCQGTTGDFQASIILDRRGLVHLWLYSGVVHSGKCPLCSAMEEAAKRKKHAAPKST